MEDTLEEVPVISGPISIAQPTAKQRKAAAPKQILNDADRDIIKRVRDLSGSAVERNRLVKVVAEEDYGNISRSLLHSLVLGNIDEAIKETVQKAYKKGVKDARNGRAAAPIEDTPDEDQMAPPKVSKIAPKPKPAKTPAKSIKPRKLYREEVIDESDEDRAQSPPPQGPRDPYEDL